MLKDAADLFAAKGEEAKETVEDLKNDARDALDLVLSEAPDGSQRERYRYVTEQVFPLLLRLEDDGERGAALDDVASMLKLGKRDLGKALGEAIESVRQSQEEHERDEDKAEVEQLMAPEPGSERHQRAMELLESPNIPERAARTMEMLGHVGELMVKMLAFVCAVSARAGYPIQPSTHAESSAGKNFLWDTVLLLLPVAMVLRWSAMSDKALFFTEEDLKGKVIYLQEVAGSEGADFAIRVLQSAQYLEYVVTEKTPDGSFKAVTHRNEGPAVVVQTTTRIRLFNENDTRVVSLYLDESPEQTRRIVDDALLRAEAGGISAEDREAMLLAWHDAIRLLETVEVVIPYARRIKLPVHRVRVRRDVNRLLDVIRVLAWLHQHRRDRDGLGRILATEEDFRMALGLVGDSFGRAWGSMSPAEEAVMVAIRSLPEAVRRNGFTRGELPLGDMDARRVQDLLKSLTESGHIECDPRRGPGGYRYTVPRDPGESVSGISLSPPDDEDGADADEGPEESEAEEEDPEPVRNTGEEENGEERVPRGSARAGGRAVDGPLSPEKVPIARSREEEDGFVFGDDEIEGDGTDEDDVDRIAGLTGLGWYRAQTVFTPEGDTEAGPPDGDPVARRLRHEVGIFKGRGGRSDAIGDPTPLAFTAEDLFEAGPPSGDGGAGDASPWPATPEQMPGRLRRAVYLLQAGERKFWDPGLSDWYEQIWTTPRDAEKVCRDANLHAELWVNDGTAEEIWTFVALREGWYVPDRAIEDAVWRRATSGRSPFAEPELLPDTTATPPEDASEPGA